MYAWKSCALVLNFFFFSPRGIFCLDKRTVALRAQGITTEENSGQETSKWRKHLNLLESTCAAFKKGPKTFENASQRRNPLYIQATQQNAYIKPNPRTAQKGLASLSSLNAAHVVLFSPFACILSVYLYFLKLHHSSPSGSPHERHFLKVCDFLCF